MWLLGHLGIGSRIARPFARGLPGRWLLLGTVLPDLIDKPLYYSLVLITGKHSTELGLISCTRTFGHTGLLIVVLAVIAWGKHSRRLAALALGMATHLLLDGLQDAVGLRFFGYTPPSSALLAAAWPFHETHFAAMPFASAGDHLHQGVQAPVTLVGEIVGALILVRDYWRPQLFRRK